MARTLVGLGLAAAGLALLASVVLPGTPNGPAASSGGVRASGRADDDALRQLTRQGVRPEDTFPDVIAVLVTPNLFYVTEHSHEDPLPQLPARPLLRLDGGPARLPSEVTVVSDAPLHRVIRVRYTAGAAVDPGRGGLVELVFPGPNGEERVGSVLSWDISRTPSLPADGR